MKTRSPKVTILCKIRPCSDENICIVPYPDSKSIVASHSPLKQLRSPDMKDPVQLNSLKSTLLEESQMMRFDSVIPGEVSQSKFYTHHLENSVVQMIAGRNLCVMVLGISTSGKSYTMRGNDGHNKGLVMRTVETLSHQITQNHLGLQIKFAAVAISGDSLFDLMNSEEPLIRNINDLTIAIREALGNRNLIVNNENKSKMHFMITLRLFQGQKEISRSDFLEFAGSEYVKEDKSIARALNSISYTLTNSCKNKRENLLSDYLKTTLDVYNPTNPSHAILICCVSPSPKHYKDSLPILKFISRVKECIDEQKLSSKDDLKTLKFQFYTEKHELERLYKDKISSLESKYAREIKRLLDYINELKELLYSNKRINIENESTGLFSDLVSITDIKHDKKVKGIESVIEESTIDPDSPLRKKPNINPKEILDLKDKLNKQDYLLKQKDKLIQEMLSINPSPEPQTKRRSYNRSVERESESDLQKRNFKMIEDSYTKKIDLLSNQLLKYQDLTKEINAELKSAKTEKVTIWLDFQTLQEKLEKSETENLELKELIYKYEKLIEENGKAACETGFKFQENLALITRLVKENEIFKNKVSLLENERNVTDREMFKFKLTSEEIQENKETLQLKIETLRIKLSDAVLTNNQLIIEKNTLRARLEEIENPYKIHKARIDRIRNQLTTLKSLSEVKISENSLCFEECII